jgi:hypothetical protein
VGNLIARLDCDDDAIIGHLKDCGKRQRRGYSAITGMLYGMADGIRKLPGTSGALRVLIYKESSFNLRALPDLGGSNTDRCPTWNFPMGHLLTYSGYRWHSRNGTWMGAYESVVLRVAALTLGSARSCGCNTDRWSVVLILCCIYFSYRGI